MSDYKRLTLQRSVERWWCKADWEPNFDSVPAIEVMPVAEHEGIAADWKRREMDEWLAAERFEIQRDRYRTALEHLYGYLWSGTPDADDYQEMMRITATALKPPSKEEIDG